MDWSLDQVVFDASVWAVPILLAITLHEAAHGYAALMFGDDTAKRAGRVTLNPLRHVDPFGTIILPVMMLVMSGGRAAFGWAKPVPVDFYRLRPARLGMVAVALAGPLTNIVLAVISLLLMYVAGYAPIGWHDWLAATLMRSFELNLILAVFNMLPLPPLDGGRVAVGLLPRPLALPLARLEPYGIFILMLFLFVLPWVADIHVFGWLVLEPARILAGALFRLFGFL